jgi:hypothetical protein
MAVSLERFARNQIVFREVNERVRELVDAWNGPAEFLCECSKEDCTETLTLHPQEYEEVRAHPNLFVILPGHETEVERIVLRNGRFTLVAKIVEADYAVKTDPRSRGQE